MSLILPKSCLVPNAIFTSLFAQGHKAQWPSFSLSPIHRLSEFQNKPGKVIAKGKFKVTTKYGSSVYTAVATIPEIHGQGHPWSGTRELHRRMFAL